MSRISYFQSPLLLGFEPLEQLLDSVAKTATEGYPPYDILHLGDDRLRITLAVAGFRGDQLAAQVENNLLTVSGNQNDDQSREYIHKGIAARQFQRTFVLADGIQVLDAWLESGLLHIDLMRPKPNSAVKKIEIRAQNNDSGRGD